VTFIANFLTTTLPNEMAVNDQNHELLVENQLGQWQALIDWVAHSGSPGAPVSQPISLGSAGTPPFGAPDSSSITPGNRSGGFQANFTVAGPATYSPPRSGGPVGTTFHPPSVTCSSTSTSISAVGSCGAYGNFSGNSQTFSFSFTGSGFAVINVTTNSSTVTVAATGSGADRIEIIGNHNTVTMTGVGSGPMNVSVIGDYDTLSIGTTGSSSIVVYVYGDHDSVKFPSTTGSQAIKVVEYGTQDTFGAPTATGSEFFKVYFNGFNASAPTSSLCPYANLSSTDAVTGYNETGSGSLTEYLNNSIGYSADATGSANCVGSNATCWGIHARNVALSTCPFFTQITLPIPTGLSKPGASLVVHLRNSYVPTAEVAYDQGAVVYAQPDGVPLMIDGPSFSYSRSNLTLTIPIFEGTIVAESGFGTADMLLSLLGKDTFVFPANGYSLKTGSRVTLSLETPYWAAWMTYFGSMSSLSGDFSCKTLAGATCPPADAVSYQPGQPLATVTLSLPATSLDLTVAMFAIQLV
jgi:hypothetical protein